MKLHANAALSLKGRRELCLRVVSGQRTVTEAAEAAEVSVRCARTIRPHFASRGRDLLLQRCLDSRRSRSTAALSGATRRQAAAALRRGCRARRAG
jgi:hypothetical protein